MKLIIVVFLSAALIILQPGDHLNLNLKNSSKFPSALFLNLPYKKLYV